MLQITIIINTIHFLLFDFLCKTVFNSVSLIKLRYAIIISLVFIKTLSSGFQNQYINLLFSIAVYTIYIFIYTRGKFNLLYNFFWVFIFIAITLFSETLVVLIMKSTTGMSIIEIMSNPVNLIISNIIGVICKVILIYIINGMYRMRSYIPEKNEYLLLIMLPSSLVLIVLSIDPIIRNNNKNIFFAFSIIYSMLSILSTINAINHMLKQEILTKELELENAQNNINQLYYNQIKKQMEKAQSIKHDMLKHYKVIYTYLMSEHYDKAIEYINWLSPQLDMPKLSHTNNSVLDALVNMYLNDIKKAEIDFKVNVCKIDLNWLNPIDMTVILGNILDNAIHSCINSINKKIYFVVDCNGGYIIFKIVNSCEHTTENEFISCKNKNRKSYGLSNIEKCAKKYGAKTIFRYDSLNREFISTIVFPRGSSK